MKTTLLLLFSLVLGQAASAGTGTVYLVGCEGRQIELAWLVPTNMGSHRTGNILWAKTTPLGATYEDFLHYFETGEYSLIHDINADEYVDANDFGLLVDRWRTQPSVWGNMARVFLGKVYRTNKYPRLSCVELTWPDGYLDPKVNLFQACVSADGTLAKLGPEQEEWRGPAIMGLNAACEGGRY